MQVYLVNIKCIFKAYNGGFSIIPKKSTVQCVRISRTNLPIQSTLSSGKKTHGCHIKPFNELKLYIRLHNIAYFILCTSYERV